LPQLLHESLEQRTRYDVEALCQIAVSGFDLLEDAAMRSGQSGCQQIFEAIGDTGQCGMHHDRLQ
jgi:hypothetical protein